MTADAAAPSRDRADVAAARATGRSLAVGLVVFLGYTLLAVLWFRETWADPAVRMVGGCCDTPIFAWSMTWFTHALGEGGTGLVTDYINSPEGANMMWQTSVPLLGIATAPLQPLGPAVPYNVVATLAVSLSGLTTYVMLRRYVGGIAGPVVGGLLFAFSPYMAGQQLGHLQFTFVPFVPLLFLALDDVLVRQSRPWYVNGALLGLAGTGQFLVGTEVLATMTMMSAVVLALLVVLHRREVRPRAGYAVRGLALAAGLMVVLLGYPLYVQFFGPQRIEGILRPPNTFVTHLAHYVEASWMTRVNDARECFRCSERGAFLGVPMIAFGLAVAVVAWRRPVVRVATLAALVAFVLSLGPSLHVDRSDTGFPLPWRVVDGLPVFEHILPIRLPMYVQLAVALLVAEGIRRLLACPVRPVAVGGLGIAAYALYLMVPVATYKTYAYPVPEFFENASMLDRVGEGDRVFVLPYPGPNARDIDPMMWQARAGMRFRMQGGNIIVPAHGRPSTGGPTNVLRRRVEELQAGRPVPPLTPELRDRLLDALFDYYRADAVLVGPMTGGRDELVAFVTDLLGRSPERVGGVDLWADISRP